MLKINYDVLTSKADTYPLLSIGERYSLAEKIFNMLVTADRNKLRETLSGVGIESLYERAENLVYAKTKKGMIIVTEPVKREITLVFESDEKDISSIFFEVSVLADRLGKTNLEKLIIIGFFMDEEKMNIIQSYNLLSNDIKEIINE